MAKLLITVLAGPDDPTRASLGFHMAVNGANDRPCKFFIPATLLVKNLVGGAAMGRGAPATTTLLASLDRLAEAAGPARASDARRVRRAIQAALPSDEAPPSCSAPQAAEILEVALPTVHVWLKAGVLQATPDSQPTRIRLDQERVDHVARKLRALRRRAPRTRKLRDIVEWLETERLGDRLRGPRRTSQSTGAPWGESVVTIWDTRPRRGA